MSKEYFIARKIHRGKSEDKKVSQPIIRISKISIVLAMIVNIVTIAVVTGFQNQVKNKVIAFGSHATIIKAGEQSTFESAPIEIDTALMQRIRNKEHVKSIHRYAYKPALLQSSPDTVFYRLNEIDTFQIQQEIQGVVMKGISQDFNWDFFEKHLVDGRIPLFSDSVVSDEIILSRRIARDLNLKVGDRVNAFFVKSQPIKDRLTIVGIFESGLEEFDKQIIIGDLKKVQHHNDWGIKASLRIADTITKDGQLVIYAEAQGGNGNYRYDWGEGFETPRGFTYCDAKDTLIRVVISDYWMFVDGQSERNSIPDTAYLSIKVDGNPYLPCKPKEWVDGEFVRHFLNESGTQFEIRFEGGKKYTIEYFDGVGSSHNYVGGYEILVNNFSHLDEVTKAIRRAIIYQDQEDPQDYRVRSIQDDQQEIFLWLSFLDLNVIIILVLMILVSTINMGSGLLVLIITKTSLIGLLKALGATNWSIRKIFLYQSMFIIVRGMIWGNIIGIGICLLQYHFNLLPLNPEVYYLSAVPIELNIWHLFLLNLGTFIMCTAVLIIPSYVVTKISPVKAIKFN